MSAFGNKGSRPPNSFKRPIYSIYSESSLKENLPYTPVISSVECGLDYLITHFKCVIWPRTISTKATENHQILVYSKEEALTWYKAANFLDCKINAYPSYTEWNGINRQAPDFIFIDKDQNRFKSKLAFDRASNKTVRNIKDTLGVSPSIIWSGGGAHLYLPVEAYVLEEESEFNRYGNPSRKFIQFAEQYLSNKKADLQHSRGLSFNNCMLRVPGSINSKYNTAVTILQRWDGNRPKIKPLLFRFDLYLLVLKANELQEAKKLDKKRSKYINTKTQDDYIDWIETLLDTSISDYRKYAVFRILARYLITIKKLSYQESFNIIKAWLDKCNSTCRLQGWSGRRTREYLDNAARKGYYPISFDKLRIENRPLYDLIRREYSR